MARSYNRDFKKTPYQLYSEKYEDRAAKLIRKGLDPRYIPAKLSPSEFAIEYNDRNLIVKAQLRQAKLQGLPKPKVNTNYVRNILSEQFDSMDGLSKKQRDAIIRFMDKKLNEYIKDQKSKGLTEKQLKENIAQYKKDVYITRLDIKYMSRKFLDRQDEINAYIKELRSQVNEDGKLMWDSYQIAKKIGEKFYGSP